MLFKTMLLNGKLYSILRNSFSSGYRIYACIQSTLFRLEVFCVNSIIYKYKKQTQFSYLLVNMNSPWRSTPNSMQIQDEQLKNKHYLIWHRWTEQQQKFVLVS